MVAEPGCVSCSGAGSVVTWVRGRHSNMGLDLAICAMLQRAWLSPSKVSHQAVSLDRSSLILVYPKVTATSQVVQSLPRVLGGRVRDAGRCRGEEWEGAD